VLEVHLIRNQGLQPGFYGLPCVLGRTRKLDPPGW
jgi:hypothetical protein